MASRTTKFVIGKALLFGLWAAGLCAGGLLPPVKHSYLMPNSTINGVASGNLSFSSLSQQKQMSPQLKVANAVHSPLSSPSPIEYWCFDTLDLSYMECCGLGDPGDDCKHAAAVCFDQVECQDGCELELAQGVAAESRTTSFSCAVPTETCVTAVTTRNDDGVPTTSSILSCAATATITLVTVTAASVTQTSLGSNYTGGHVSSSQASVESAVSKTATGNFTKLTTNILPGLLPTSQALTSILIPPSSFTSSPTMYPPAVASTTEATHASPVLTSSALPLATTTASDTPFWQNSGVIGGLAMGGFMVILGGLALFFEIQYIREMNQKKKQEELEMRLTQRLQKKEKKTSTKNVPSPVAGVALFVPPKQKQKPLQGRGPFDEKKDGDGNKEKVTASSSMRTASFNAEIVAALAASKTGVLYDSTGDMRCADFSLPCLRDRNSDNKNNNNNTSSGGGGEMEARHTESVEPKSSCSFESYGANAMDLSEIGKIQEATAVRYYSPHAGQGQQIVHL